MKTRNELIGHFMRCIEYDDENNIVDELRKKYNVNYSNYLKTQQIITDLVSFEDFSKYENATVDLTTIIVCNAFILGYEQCKKDLIEDINKSTKNSPLKKRALRICTFIIAQNYKAGNRREGYYCRYI